MLALVRCLHAPVADQSAMLRFSGFDFLGSIIELCCAFLVLIFCSDCDIRERGAVALAEALQGQSSLRDLDLRGEQWMPLQRLRYDML